MLRIDCPFCGTRNHDEFSYEGDATVTFPSLDNTSEEAWYKAVFERSNPRGAHQEHWYHVQGCKMYLVVHRDTVTHEITSVEPAHPGYRAHISLQAKGGRK